jgi:hypothetical protein
VAGRVATARNETGLMESPTGITSAIYRAILLE